LQYRDLRKRGNKLLQVFHVVRRKPRRCAAVAFSAGVASDYEKSSSAGESAVAAARLYSLAHAGNRGRLVAGAEAAFTRRAAHDAVHALHHGIHIHAVADRGFYGAGVQVFELVRYVRLAARPMAMNSTIVAAPR
jgi:hypothetical protein